MGWGPNRGRAAGTTGRATGATVEATLVSVDLTEVPSLVVLPFESLSAAPDHDFFAEGLTEDLIIELSKIGDLFVISRNSSLSYRGREVDTASVCAELGVKHVLRGTVRRSGDRLRVTATLQRGEDAANIWAERYDRAITDVFGLQDELVEAIVAVLAVKLTSTDEQRLGVYGTDVVEALDLFLRGRQLMLRHNRESIMAARDPLLRAIELDPAFARPYATLGATYLLDFINGWSANPPLAMARAESLAGGAALREPNNPDAQFTLGFAALLGRRYTEAQSVAEALIGLDPSPGHHLMANVLHYTGFDERALRHLDLAVKLDPHHPDITLYFRAMMLFGLARYREALQSLQERARRNPTSDSTHAMIAATLGQLGEAEGAHRAWARTLEINAAYSVHHRARVLPYRGTDTFDRVVVGLQTAGITIQ